MAKPPQFTGTVVDVLGNNNYDVEIEIAEGQKKVVRCYKSGKMSMHNINIMPNDKVVVDLPPPYDKGRISFRNR